MGPCAGGLVVVVVNGSILGDRPAHRPEKHMQQTCFAPSPPLLCADLEEKAMHNQTIRTWQCRLLDLDPGQGVSGGGHAVLTRGQRKRKKTKRENLKKIGVPNRESPSPLST